MLSGAGWGRNGGNEYTIASNAGGIIETKMIVVWPQVQIFVFKNNSVGVLVPQSVSYITPVSLIPTAFNVALILFGLYFLINSISNFLIGNLAIGVASIGPLLASLMLALYLIIKKMQLK